MRKTLLLKGLDLVRPCPGHESYTSEEKKKTGTTTDTISKPTICSLCHQQIVKYLVFKSGIDYFHNANFIAFTVKVELDLFVSSLFNPFILKCD